VFVDEGPRDVLYLITTAKYQEAQKRVGVFLKSTIMPAKIKQPFAELVKIINDNIELMVRVLNKRVMKTMTIS
jgi:hypothetical protein